MNNHALDQIPLRDQKEEFNEQRVGNYILKKKMGSGNFAVVRLGIHTLTGAKVC